MLVGSAIFSLAAFAARPGGGTTTSYVGEALGVLPNDSQSIAYGVSSNGAVVGMSGGDAGEHAFYWNPNTRTMHDLTSAGVTGTALAVAGVATEYAVGQETTQAGTPYAVIWIAPPSSAIPLETTSSIAIGVNDWGTAVGGFEGKAVIWTLVGGQFVRTDIPHLQGNVESYATDVNNDGIVVGYGYAEGANGMTAFLRLNSGVLVTIPPRSGDAASSAQAVSDIVVAGTEQVVYVTGSSGEPFGFGSRQAIRWTVNIATGEIVETLPLNLLWAAGVNNAGDVAGTASSRSKQTASLWRDGAYIALKPPKGGVASASRGMPRLTGTVTYVAGQATINKRLRAMRWVVQ